MTKNKMGAMSSLRSLSGIKSQKPEQTPPPPGTQLTEPEIKEETTEETKPLVRKTAKTSKKKEKLVKININITKKQKDWLTDTASMVRDNNTSPVPPADRVYPQHLIGVAIELLKAADVDWSQVKNIEELRNHLNL